MSMKGIIILALLLLNYCKVQNKESLEHKNSESEITQDILDSSKLAKVEKGQKRSEEDCYEDEYWDPYDGECYQCPIEHCAKCYYSNPYDCKYCKAPYELYDDGYCYIEQDPEDCYEDEYWDPDDGECYQCPIYNCAKCEYRDPYDCKECKNHYELDSDGECQHKDHDPEECYSGEYWDPYNYECYECPDPGCNKCYYPNTDNCKECERHWNLQDDGTCEYDPEAKEKEDEAAGLIALWVILALLGLGGIIFILNCFFHFLGNHTSSEDIEK